MLVPLQTVPQVVVSATRIETTPFDVPGSVDRIDGESIRDGRLQVNLSESLAGVPGLAVQNRQNYAQDLQISVRGIGARSTFGVRGVRIYIDDIPATMPDGQGQTSNIDLGSVGRIEVLRGPFSALYGNSSGGVLAVFTQNAPEHSTLLSPAVALGSNQTRRTELKLATAGGTDGAVGIVASASHFSTNGWRDHSAATRDLANAKATITVDPSDTLTLVVNSVRLPNADDPLGLSRAQYAAAPRSVDPSALQFDTRKALRQTQAGAVYERKLDVDNTVRLMVYTGDRTTVQYQSIPVASQIPATSPGGVIDLGRSYSGVDARWLSKLNFGEQNINVVAGINYDLLDEHRLGFQNFIGAGAGVQLGVKGAPRRDEDNRIYDFDQYAQLSWQLNPQWNFSGGLRRNSVVFRSRDHYIVAGNPDDSGDIRYRATLPVLSVLYAKNDDLHWYATAGRGFETPTGNELAYSPSGATGLNLALQPARSNNYEAGLKARLFSGMRINAALFASDTRNEIVTLTNEGGRSTFTNAGRTKRRGAEFLLETPKVGSWHALLAYTHLQATYADAFLTCTATPCSVPTGLISAGKRIPGTARSFASGELSLEPPEGWRAGLEARASSRIFVNDMNSDAAPGYATVNLGVGYLAKIAGTTVNISLRADNLFNRKYAGSVIVNEGNGRYFESAPERNWLLAINASHSW